MKRYMVAKSTRGLFFASSAVVFSVTMGMVSPRMSDALASRALLPVGQNSNISEASIYARAR